MTTGYVSPVGYVDLDNDCAYSLDIKSTRSRESVDQKTDLAFYFNTYIEPVYGLGNINVKNCASFMKDLEMNWTKIDPELKDKVLQYMVDGIFTKDKSYDFKKRFLAKLGVPETPIPVQSENKSTFGKKSENSILLPIVITVLVLAIVIFLLDRLFKNKSGPYSKLS